MNYSFNFVYIEMKQILKTHEHFVNFKLYILVFLSYKSSAKIGERFEC